MLNERFAMMNTHTHIHTPLTMLSDLAPITHSPKAKYSTPSSVTETEPHEMKKEQNRREVPSHLTVVPHCSKPRVELVDVSQSVKVRVCLGPPFPSIHRTEDGRKGWMEKVEGWTMRFKFFMLKCKWMIRLPLPKCPMARACNNVRKYTHTHTHTCRRRHRHT